MIDRRPSRRAGRLWLLQRVSAVLLVAGIGLHFAIQHFSPAALSTALTVCARFSRPGWQAFYAGLLALALFHGVNGVVGVLRDHVRSRACFRATAIALWALTAVFLAIGLVNIHGAGAALPAIKSWYARHGLPDGTSRGSPPLAPQAGRYAFGGDEMRELHLLHAYLEHHTRRTEADPATAATIFAAVDPADAATGGAAFDAWALARLREAPVLPADPGRAFSSTREFALWALHVRRADARRRGDDPAALATRARLADLPPYRPGGEGR